MIVLVQLVVFLVVMSYELLYMTNKMQLLESFIINTALHVLGNSRPSSEAYKL